MARFDELDAMGDSIGRVYADCVDRLLVNIARHFKYLQPGEEPGGAFQWQARKLAELGQVNRENVAIIRRMLGDVPAELADGLEQAILDALADIEEPLKQAAEDGLMGDITPPPEPDPRAMQAFRLYHGQSLDGLNLVNSRMLESTAEAYRGMVADITNRLLNARETINAATGEVLAGVESFNRALELATRRLLDAGLTGFVDGGGRHWKPDTYVAMTMRSTYHNVSRAAFWERNEEYANDLYLVSQHPGARPLCYPWQCKVISRKDEARDVTDGDGQPVHVYAQSETTYGEPAGLFGINCGHHPELFIPGATKIPELMQNEQENAETYALSQKQRKLEREFRKARLAYESAKAQGAEKTTIDAAREKLKRADERLDRFEKETGRRRRREREYGPVQAKGPDQRQNDLSANSGAVSGAKKTPGWQDRHAERYYEGVRRRKPGVDASKIAKHTEFTEEQAEDIRQHMFIREQPLENGTRIARFAPDFDQAQAWQRLTEGRGTDTDILMLKHEYLELTEMREHGYNYDEAHAIANEKYNWWEAVFNERKGVQ